MLEFFIVWLGIIAFLIIINIVNTRETPKMNYDCNDFSMCQAIDHLVNNGFKIYNGVITNIKLKADVTHKDLAAINYLFIEWDYVYEEK